MPLARFIALLRGINVSGHNKIPMAELRAACAELGWSDVQSYIQSGNVVFQATGTAASLEAALEQAVQQHFGLAIPVVVRAAADWPAYVAGNPFLTESGHEPNLVLLALSKSLPTADAVERLRERGAHGERIAQVGDALWIHYQQGVARSRLSPALFDRLVGSAVTARNWRTVLRLNELAVAPL